MLFRSIQAIYLVFSAIVILSGVSDIRVREITWSEIRGELATVLCLVSVVSIAAKTRGGTLVLTGCSGILSCMLIWEFGQHVVDATDPTFILRLDDAGVVLAWFLAIAPVCMCIAAIHRYRTCHLRPVTAVADAFR